MARKRKIPVRKHHGIRDPLKQQEVKEKRLKNVVNGPPQKDDQKMSHKFIQFKKLADQAKNGQKIKRIRSGVEDKPKDYRTAGASLKKKNHLSDGNKFKSIKQLPGEEDLDYLRRVNRITSESLKEAQYEARYGVKVVRNPKTGEISIKKKPPNEIDELLKQRKMEMRGGKKKKGTDRVVKSLDPNLVKKLIKQAIQEDEQEKRKEKEKEIIEYRKDEVKFGEIVHAPPMLALPKKANKNETVPRPGKKENLLLKDLLKSQKTEDSHSKIDNNDIKSISKKGKSASIISKNHLKGKRKDLPEATRNMLEIERQKLVSHYRNLKKFKGIHPDKS